MTSNDSHMNHDECLVLTVYSLYILAHTEHQTTTSIFILLIFYCKPQVTVYCKWWILLLTYWLIDWSWCEGYLWRLSYTPTYWTSSDSHINHGQCLVLPYILTHNWKLFHLNVWCSMFHWLSAYIVAYTEHQRTTYTYYGCYVYIWCSSFIPTYMCGMYVLLPDWWWWRWWHQMTHISAMTSAWSSLCIRYIF